MTWLTVCLVLTFISLVYLSVKRWDNSEGTVWRVMGYLLTKTDRSNGKEQMWKQHSRTYHKGVIADKSYWCSPGKYFEEPVNWPHQRCSKGSSALLSWQDMLSCFGKRVKKKQPYFGKEILRRYKVHYMCKETCKAYIFVFAKLKITDKPFCCLSFKRQ